MASFSGPGKSARTSIGNESMSTLETQSAHLGAPREPAAHESSEAERDPPPAGRRKGFFGKLFLLFLLGCSGAGAFYVWSVGIEKARRDALGVLGYIREHSPASSSSHAGGTAPAESTPAQPWDGYVRISLEDAKTIR